MIEIENKTQHKLDDEYTPLPKLELLLFFFSMSLEIHPTYLSFFFLFFLTSCHFSYSYFFDKLKKRRRTTFILLSQRL